MEFRDYLYLDENRINKYYKEIGGIIPDKDKELIENNIELDAGGGIKFAKANGNHTKTKQVEINRTYEVEDILRLLEIELQKGEKVNFFNLDDDDVDINTVPKGSIIKFEGELEVPHEFDEIDFIKTMLNNPATSEQFMKDIVSSNPSDEEIFKLLVKDGREIPVYFDLEELALYSNIKSENLNVEYDEFENYIGDEVTIIAKIEKYDRKEKIKIYDKYKDLFKINRAMRREIEGEDGDIYIEGPGKKVSIIAIYV